MVAMRVKRRGGGHIDLLKKNLKNPVSLPASLESGSYFLLYDILECQNM